MMSPRNPPASLRRYWRQPPIGQTLSRERLILGLQQLAQEWGRSLPSAEQQRWLAACQLVFGLTADEIRFLALALSNAPSEPGAFPDLPSLTERTVQP